MKGIRREMSTKGRNWYDEGGQKVVNNAGRGNKKRKVALKLSTHFYISASTSDWFEDAH